MYADAALGSRADVVQNCHASPDASTALFDAAAFATAGAESVVRCSGLTCADLCHLRASGCRTWRHPPATVTPAAHSAILFRPRTEPETRATHSYAGPPRSVSVFTPPATSTPTPLSASEMEEQTGFAPPWQNVRAAAQGAQVSVRRHDLRDLLLDTVAQAATLGRHTQRDPTHRDDDDEEEDVLTPTTVLPAPRQADAAPRSPSPSRLPVVSLKTWRFPHFDKVVSPSRLQRGAKPRQPSPTTPRPGRSAAGVVAAAAVTPRPNSHHSPTSPPREGNASWHGTPAYERLLDTLCAAYTRHTATAPQVQLGHRSSSLSVSGPLGRSAGYYSFNLPHTPHPNRQPMPFTPAFLRRGSATSQTSLPGRASRVGTAVGLSRANVSDALLTRIARRPLLQTTVFLAHVLPRCRDIAATATGVAGCTPKTPGSDSTRADALPDDAARRFQRPLTQVTRLVRHVHAIDGVEREVDNESYNLVVRVGMHLMGWLEVVSLLGAGSFGQVFLCKDLRICDGHFVHPGEIDGDDFAYWNCSHAYLPYGDCGVAPSHHPLVAVKVVKSVPLFEQQSVVEAEMFVTVGAQTDQSAPTGGGNGDPPPPDPRVRFVATVLADGVCYGHHCIVMERYGANLYEYVQSNAHRGLPMYQIRSIGRQLLSALSLLHDRCDIVHADIKPENLMLTLDSCRSARPARAASAATHGSYITLRGSTAMEGPSRAATGMESDSLPAPEPLRVHALTQTSAMIAAGRGTAVDETPGAAVGPTPALHIKLIDFSSSCYRDQCCYTYIQSRYYRAPEVIVGAPYGPPIDLWGCGCVLAELLLGMPLLAGCSDHHQLTLIEEMIGKLPPSVLASGTNTTWYYAVSLPDGECHTPHDRGQEIVSPDDTGGEQQQQQHAPSSSTYVLRSREDYLAHRHAPAVEYTRYFTYRTMQELVRHGPLSREEHRMCNGLPPYSEDAQDEGTCTAQGGALPTTTIRAELLQQRFMLFDLLRRLLHTDPAARPTASQALQHAFFTSTPSYAKLFKLQ